MKFTPKYNVFYGGVFHKSGEAFEINDKDAEEMRKHGKVEQPIDEGPRRGRPPRN